MTTVAGPPCRAGYPGVGDAGGERGDGRAAAPGPAGAAAGVRGGGAAGATRRCARRWRRPAEPTATARWPGTRRCGRPPRGTGPGAACPPARARSSAARAASRCCSPCCWPSAAASPAAAVLGQLRRAGGADRHPPALGARARPGRAGYPTPAPWPPRPARRPRPGGRSARCWSPCPTTRPGGCRPRPRSPRCARSPPPRAGHHLRRDLPRPDPRPGHPRAQPRPGRARADRDHHRRQQEPGAGRLADRRGPDARRPVRPPAAPRPARRGQRDLVRARRAHPARRRPGLHRTPAHHRPHRGQPRPARPGRRRRRRRMRQRRADRPAAARPDFTSTPTSSPGASYLHARHQVTTSAALARLLLNRYGVATLPGSAFGEPPAALRLRLATALLYGDTPQQQEAALTAPDPTTLPWIAAALTRLSEILTDLANPSGAAGSRGTPRRTGGSGSSPKLTSHASHAAPRIGKPVPRAAHADEADLLCGQPAATQPSHWLAMRPPLTRQNDPFSFP